MTRKTKNASAEVGVVMGSDSDWPLLEETVRTLDRFGVVSEVRVLSAHRTPEEAAAYARTAFGRGLRVIIAAAGGRADLQQRLKQHKAALRNKVADGDSRVQQSLAKLRAAPEHVKQG